MNAMAPVDKSSPLYQAWLRYRESDEYANTKRWATHDEHTEGSLWAAFCEGFNGFRPHAKREPVSITGIWLRREGDEAVVLVEVDGQWRKVISEYYDGAFSHIAEQAAIRKAPVDDVTTPA